jgi:hypothetical protein
MKSFQICSTSFLIVYSWPYIFIMRKVFNAEIGCLGNYYKALELREANPCLKVLIAIGGEFEDKFEFNHQLFTVNKKTNLNFLHLRMERGK